ncbi:MAG TPA: hypothetical protein VF808_12930 [Ktedonobacterales bacterium]
MQSLKPSLPGNVAPAERLDVDIPPIRWAPWLTPRELLLFVIGWLTLFAALSAFISNPFQSETSAAATPDYARVMFLHGLLIGMVGLVALLTCQTFRLRSMHARVWIAGGVVVATILAAVGGIWDKTIPGSEVPMWTQILGFFALDEILLTLIIGLALEWRRDHAARTLLYAAAMAASASAFIAAIMGHLAGWIMEFGNSPALIGDFSRFAGFALLDDFTGALVGSHSHEMAVAVMALTITILAQQFGADALRGVSRVLAQTGAALVATGVVVMTAIYVAGAVSQWGPPTLFISGANDANGIAGDDIVTGILVIGGGVLVIAAFALLRSAVRQPLRLAAMWAWVLSFATVVIAGFAIEMNEVYFGAGDASAPGAAKDAVFTWLHQDIGLFLLPATVIVLLVAERLIRLSRAVWVGWAMLVGTTVTFVGGLVFVFVDPALHGAGYLIMSVGLAVMGIATLTTIWMGIDRRTRTLPLRKTAPLHQTKATTEPAETPAPERVPALS